MEVDKILQKIDNLEKNLYEKITNIQKEMKGLIEIQQRLIHERLRVPMPPPPNEYGEEKPVKTTNNNKIQISKFGENHIKLSGGTYKYKNLIKSLEFARWEDELKIWSLPLNHLSTLIETFKQANLEENKDFEVNIETKVIELHDEEEESSSKINIKEFSFVDDY